MLDLKVLRSWYLNFAVSGTWFENVCFLTGIGLHCLEISLMKWFLNAVLCNCRGWDGNLRQRPEIPGFKPEAESLVLDLATSKA